MSHSGPFEHRSGRTSGRRGGGPPNLAQYSDEPKYDLSTIVQLVGVRSMTLWSWEQQLGIPAPVRIGDEGGSPIRRYSERDLIAALWLRDQIVKGVSPSHAADTLLSAQQALPTAPETPNERGGSGPVGEPSRARVNTGPLPESTLAPQRTPKPTMPLSDVERPPTTSGKLSPYGAAENLGRSQAADPPRWTRPHQMSSPLPPPRVQHQPYESFSDTPQTGRTSGQLHNPETSGTTWVNYDALPRHMVSGPLPLMPGHAPHSPATDMRPEPARGEGTSGLSWIGPGAATHGPELRVLLPQLVRALANLDTFAANHIVSQALAQDTSTVEKVCMSLLQPALAHANDIWAQHQTSGAERQFAENYVRGVLYAIFHKTPEHFEAPMVIVGCGPRERNDIAALVLAVFWRRAGLRVIFLGQDVDARDLVHTAHTRRPALVALVVTTTQRVRSLNKLGKEIQQVAAPRPIFAFSGSVFARHPDLQYKVSGVYLGDDPNTATWHVANMLIGERGD